MSRTRKYDKPRAWEDYYRPTDFYSLAQGWARQYCKNHPEADRELVYIAASEAADVYELSPQLRRAKFKTVVAVKIRTTLYNSRGETDMITDQDKQNIIDCAKKGMSAGQIAAKYKFNPKTTQYHITKARKNGLLPPKNQKNAKHDVQPEPDRSPEAYPEQIYGDEPEPTVEEDVKVFLPGENNTLEKTIKGLQESVTNAWDGLVSSLTDPPAPSSPPENCCGHSCGKRKSGTACECSQHIPGLWEDISDELCEFVCGVLGTGTKVLEKASSEKSESAAATLETPDGKHIKIKMKVV